MFTSRLSKQSPRTSARPQDPNFLPQWLPDGSFSCRYGVLTPDEVQLARANFVEFDVDRDGGLSRMDFHMAMARHSPAWAAPAKRGQLDAMYAAVDTDGDGRQLRRLRGDARAQEGGDAARLGHAARPQPAAADAAAADGRRVADDLRPAACRGSRCRAAAWCRRVRGWATSAAAAAAAGSRTRAWGWATSAAAAAGRRR